MQCCTRSPMPICSMIISVCNVCFVCSIAQRQTISFSVIAIAKPFPYSLYGLIRIMLVSRLAVLLGSVATAVIVPGPPGPYSVSMSVLSLEDKSRLDPYSPAGHREHRRVLLSVFLPAAKSCPVQRVPYMTPTVASYYGQQALQYGLPNTTFASFDYELCDLSRLPSCGRRSHRPSYPVVIYDTAINTSRLLYGARARSLASYGYAVITVDHPYDAPIVEFPDGTVILGGNISQDNETAIEADIEVHKHTNHSALLIALASDTFS